MGIPLLPPHDLPIPPSSGSAATANPVGPSYVTYEIWVQDNNFNLVGVVDQYDKFSMVPRFNAVGSWALTVDAAHPMAGYLKTRGYGIYVNRWVQDSNGHVIHSDTPFFSGPMRNWSRQNQAGVKTLTVSGGDNLLYVASRDARPVYDYPYSSLAQRSYTRDDGIINSFVNPLGPPFVYYQFADTSGTTAVDVEGVSNGTYHGGVTLNQTGGLDDPGGAILLDGSTGYVDSNTTGVGNGGAWSTFVILGWFKIVSLPSGANKGRLCSNSAPGTSNKGFAFYVDSSGVLWGFAGNGTTSGSISQSGLNTGIWYFAAFWYDGAHLNLYVNSPNLTSPLIATPVAFTGTIPTDGTTTMKFGAEASSPTSNFFSGYLQQWTLYHSFADSTNLLQLYQVGQNHYAWQSVDSQRSEAAETLMVHFVNRNAGPGAITARQVAGLSVPAGSGQGSSVFTSARFDHLIAKDGTGLLETIARASAPELGFKCVQSGRTITFSAYTPNDKTSSLIFSDELGNLGDVTYDVEAPDYEAEGNAVIVGGSGAGTARVFYEATDNTSVTNWGRAEAFVDKRDAGDSATLATEATADLAKFKEKVTFSAQLMPQSGITYGVDFNLGDKVTCVMDGAVVVQDIVREVQIDLDPASGEVVTIAVGTPGASAQPSGNPSITGRFYGPSNATPAKHGKQPTKHLKGTHHAKHVKKAAHRHHHAHHVSQKLGRYQ